jgi:hypothetical protein
MNCVWNSFKFAPQPARSIQAGHGRGPSGSSLFSRTIRAQCESKSAMSKRQLIDDIRQYNLSVQPQFLAQFDNSALEQYLEHLRDAARKHVRIAGWVKKPQARVRVAS